MSWVIELMKSQPGKCLLGEQGWQSLSNYLCWPWLRVFECLVFLKHITLVSSLDLLISRYSCYFHSTDVNAVAQYTSEKVSKSNTHVAVEFKIILKLHRLIYLSFCVMPRRHSLLVLTTPLVPRLQKKVAHSVHSVCT